MKKANGFTPTDQQIEAAARAIVEYQYAVRPGAWDVADEAARDKFREAARRALIAAATANTKPTRHKMAG